MHLRVGLDLCAVVDWSDLLIVLLDQDRNWLVESSIIFQVRSVFTSFHLLEPALWIFVVVERDSLLCQLECVLRVEHHCELFGARCAPARHDRARMRAVRNATRMERN